MAQAIINQQLSMHAAATIYQRVRTAAGGEFTPARIRDTSEPTLRAAGMSGAKVRALDGLADALIDGDLDVISLDGVSDDDAFAQLVALRGVGPWTAQVFLMFALHRGDVLAPADVAALSAGIECEILWRLLTDPHGATIRQIGVGDGRLAYLINAIGASRRRPGRWSEALSRLAARAGQPDPRACRGFSQE